MPPNSGGSYGNLLYSSFVAVSTSSLYSSPDCPSPSTPSPSGESILRQVADEPTGIVALFALVIAGSLVPAFLNAKPEAFGPFKPTSEMINGRGAMIGLAAMLVIEASTGYALF